MSHLNEELLRRGFDAYAHRDLDAISRILHPDVAWHWPGRSPMAGDYRGIGEVLMMFARAFERAGDSLTFDVHDVLANDEHGIALVVTTVTRRGETYEDRSVYLVHFGAGTITEVWTYAWDQYADDALWSS
jgi:hypothetical protein